MIREELREQARAKLEFVFRASKSWEAAKACQPDGSECRTDTEISAGNAFSLANWYADGDLRISLTTIGIDHIVYVPGQDPRVERAASTTMAVDSAGGRLQAMTKDPLCPSPLLHIIPRADNVYVGPAEVFNQVLDHLYAPAHDHGRGAGVVKWRIRDGVEFSNEPKWRDAVLSEIRQIVEREAEEGRVSIQLDHTDTHTYRFNLSLGNGSPLAGTGTGLRVVIKTDDHELRGELSSSQDFAWTA